MSSKRRKNVVKFNSKIKRYAKFVKQHFYLFDFVVAPDVPGSIEATVRNTQEFASVVEEYVPVLQGKSLREYLMCLDFLRRKKLLRSRMLVGIGNITPFKNNGKGLMEFSQILKKLKESGLEKMHLFGANLRVLKKTHSLLYSCDIGAWQREIAFRRRTTHNAPNIEMATLKALLTYEKKIAELKRTYLS